MAPPTEPAPDLFQNIGATVQAVAGSGGGGDAENGYQTDEPQVVDNIGEPGRHRTRLRNWFTNYHPQNHYV